MFILILILCVDYTKTNKENFNAQSRVTRHGMHLHTPFSTKKTDISGIPVRIYNVFVDVFGQTYFDLASPTELVPRSYTEYHFRKKASPRMAKGPTGSGISTIERQQARSA